MTLREVKNLLALRGQHPREQELVAAALAELQNRTDAPESWKCVDRRRRARDADRARQVTRDRQRATPAVDDHNDLSVPAPVLHVLPGGITTSADDPVDLTDLIACEVWTTPGSREDQPDPSRRREP